MSWEFGVGSWEPVGWVQPTIDACESNRWVAPTLQLSKDRRLLAPSLGPSHQGREEGKGSLE